MVQTIHLCETKQSVSGVKRKSFAGLLLAVPATGPNSRQHSPAAIHKKANGMQDSAPQTIYLADYTPPAYLIDTVHLTFHLHPTRTRVISRIAFRPNPDTSDRTFTLHGADLTLVSAKIDGNAVSPTLTNDGLTCIAPDAPFIWEAEVTIAPETNTALEGLYMSGGMYCTQCEAEGFRKITYYPDRPDVMAVFTVRVEGNYPVLLSNGNPQASGDGWAEWHDPWPKPAYLFALVAGDLVAHSAAFTTMSGRDVALNIYVRPGPDEDKCAFGMGALQRSMTWDEQVYGREYDLDIFNIVAVDDFNMGAMENKGLNIFNSSCVLASPATSTDADFERIEAIIAHEYFHNWTGNRITCRDWFQLCLKEGLTVYRDQQFTADMRSAPVKRIDDAVGLRAHQFGEDAGPLAHPPRPASFSEINNFYTSTVYEKGAEIIGMLHTLAGDDGYKSALDLYFDRHDGDAATIEDFRVCFEQAMNTDLIQFAHWWTDPGTPHVTVTETWVDTGTLTIHLTQATSAAGRTDWPARVIPLRYALIGSDGLEMQKEQLLTLDTKETAITIEGLTSRPILSINRGFTAPIVLHQTQSDAQRAILLAHDTDPFNRWDAGRALVAGLLQRMVKNGTPPETQYLDAMLIAIRDDTLDPAYRAFLLSFPTQTETAQSLFDAGAIPDPDAIHLAHQTLKQALAEHLQDHLASLYAAMTIGEPYSPDAIPAGKRDLGNAVLGLLSRLDGGKQAATQYAQSDNMTQQISALAALLHNGHNTTQLDDFAEQWKDDRLVMDKWFGLQVGLSAPEDTVATVKTLSQHPDFNIKNPNRFRAVFGAFSRHAAGFHRAGGSGYDLLADWLITLDPINPQTTARVVTAFDSLRRYDAGRQTKMRAALERIQATPNLSGDTAEMVNRILKG
jgi:aminopeptidase N